MKKITLFTLIFSFIIGVSISQTKEKQPFKFNIVKNDSINFNNLSSQMELIAADSKLEIVSYDMIAYVYENRYKFTMNGSKLAESIVEGIKKINPKPKRIVVENIVAFNESEGKEKTYSGFTLYLK